jgi:hypothetical protein
MTAALSPHQVPLLLAALLALIEVCAIMFPCIFAAAPMLAEDPTMKYTLQAWALFINTTEQQPRQ